jgi:glycosyltransferase involved in cell wall biosynthesis
MAHGVPVVASGTSSLPEVGGNAALYFDPHDPRDIAEKIVQALEDDLQRSTMIARGSQRVRQFTWRRTAEANLRVYEEALAM